MKCVRYTINNNNYRSAFHYIVMDLIYFQASMSTIIMFIQIMTTAVLQLGRKIMKGER